MDDGSLARRKRAVWHGHESGMARGLFNGRVGTASVSPLFCPIYPPCRGVPWGTQKAQLHEAGLLPVFRPHPVLWSCMYYMKGLMATALTEFLRVFPPFLPPDQRVPFKLRYMSMWQQMPFY